MAAISKPKISSFICYFTQAAGGFNFTLFLLEPEEPNTMRLASYSIIEGWVEAVDLSIFSTTEATGDITPQIHDGTSIPSTPPRHSNKVFEETSPTDTSFSANTIFDTPVHKNIHLNHAPSSDSGSQNAYSDNTTVYNEYHHVIIARKQDPPDRGVILNTHKISSDQPDTIISSHVYEQDKTLHLVSLTSCLQCILLHLPCSRTYPSCTRCIRNGHADLCLLHRRRFAFESWESGGPILLKVKGEDEEVWKRKLELREVLWEEWMAEQEKKNWVLPSVLGERGGWKRGATKVEEREGYPGEGMGRVVLKELVVDVKD